MLSASLHAPQRFVCSLLGPATGETRVKVSKTEFAHVFWEISTWVKGRETLDHCGHLAQPAHRDGLTSFYKDISKGRLYSWNFRGQDPQEGPHFQRALNPKLVFWCNPTGICFFVWGRGATSLIAQMLQHKFTSSLEVVGAQLWTPACSLHSKSSLSSCFPHRNMFCHPFGISFIFKKQSSLFHRSIMLLEGISFTDKMVADLHRTKGQHR